MRLSTLVGLLAGANKFPMSLIPIEDASLWTLNDLSADGSYNGETFGAKITSEGWLKLKSSNINSAAATLKKAIDFTMAGEIVLKYSQTYSMVPRVSLVNVSTGKTDYMLTPTAYGTLNDVQTAKLDVSAAKGRYYVSVDTVNAYGDRDCYVKNLDITRRA